MPFNLLLIDNKVSDQMTNNIYDHYLLNYAHTQSYFNISS